jgi:hypothetical protein
MDIRHFNNSTFLFNSLFNSLNNSLNNFSTIQQFCETVKQYSPTFGSAQQGTGNAKQLALPNTEVAPALRHQKVQAVRVGGRVLQRHLCGPGKRTIGPCMQWYMSEMDQVRNDQQCQVMVRNEEKCQQCQQNI